jgi:hypothetical protein
LPLAMLGCEGTDCDGSIRCSLNTMVVPPPDEGEEDEEEEEDEGEGAEDEVDEE